VLALGTTLLAIADKGPVNFHRGAYYLAYEAVMDLFGLALVAGTGLALYRRLAVRPESLGHQWSDLVLLGLLLAVGVTGFLLEAFRLHWDGTPPQVARWSFVANALAGGISALAGDGGARTWHLATWWVHVALITALFGSFTHTRLFHALTGTLNLLLRPEQPAGALTSLSLVEVEETGKVGLIAPTDLTWQQRLSLDACMECGRCEEVCPAHSTGKPLSPKRLIQDLKQAMAAPGAGTQPLSAAIGSETLWACTMCQACVFECPVRIGHVELVAGLRRHLVGEGALSGPPAQALQRLGRQGNPFGQPARERLAWAAGLNVPTVEQEPEFEVLLWVGCAATFDPRAQKVARATVQLLQQAGVRFAVLGRNERCTGDPARRLGDDFAFQQLAGENAEQLGVVSGRQRRVVTPCPHCMNTLRHEYGEFGADLEVVHHSQFLAELVAEGKLAAASGSNGAATLHDPCYLARVNGETTHTRSVLGAAGLDLREMPRSRERTFCCGSGGGRAWFEERPDQRVNRQRAAEALATGAATVATGCPFCLNMMTDGVAATPGAEQVRVADIAELLWERVRSSAETPMTH
jgi:Fe-S oxidoreductase